MAFKSFPPPGSPPGVLEHRAGRQTYPSRLCLIWYDGDRLEENANANAEDFLKYQDRAGIRWLHLEGLEDLTLLQDLGAQLGLHVLALEDVVEGRAPVKVEDYSDYLFIVSRLPTDLEEFQDEQISIFLGADFLLSVQESHIDHFAIIRERLRHGQGQIRQHGADYLAYTLLDFAVDSWFPILGNLGERLDQIEDRLLNEPLGQPTTELQGLRRQLLRGRRLMWPLRESINYLLHHEGVLISERSRIYLRDCYDHTFQIIDLLENYRDMASGLIEVYLSSLNTRLNEVMKVLTVIATIFIPLNFLASLYGMNFKTNVSSWNMPELSWPFGYPFALGLMLIVALAMVIYFKRKKWI
ncbi:magnesium/cobalt transporter CorA [Desulfobacca acetoxidans]|uniref:Magnesium transport protein CorA n=1 Tax=Desulfobacca acetoxidans (strain ATCC 700848 / DSM 11109 / ASRB2) TaxID=880072 RepID=F2NCU0_DESAR|nr:magnesium/cobalt transporter CorA [Desulfobacca acetoxidans]AEB09371.1 magnesium and cobalt transport protein CorA [Desulfobacca acetoxidans DSM 11109]